MARKKICLEYMSERVLSETKYLLITQSTIEKTAKFSGKSVGTIHSDLNDKLPKINAELYREVRTVINKNIEERSYRGAEVKKQKILELKNKTKMFN
jgi:sporulation transcriptional regulator SpoIIID